MVIGADRLVNFIIGICLNALVRRNDRMGAAFVLARAPVYTMRLTFRFVGRPSHCEATAALHATCLVGPQEHPQLLKMTVVRLISVSTWNNCPNPGHANAKRRLTRPFARFCRSEVGTFDSPRPVCSDTNTHGTAQTTYCFN